MISDKLPTIWYGGDYNPEQWQDPRIWEEEDVDFIEDYAFPIHDIATSLGVKVQIYRVIFLAISVVLAGIAVAFAGGIGFIGLMAPHIARTLIGRSFAGLIPVSALVGSFLVMAADLIGRSAFLPSDIPAGVFTASIGAPFFIYLPA